MASFNNVVLMGNMTRDPETRQTAGGATVCSFGMAMNRKFKGQDGEAREEATFVEISAWGRLGEVIQQYCTKGKLILIEGRLKYETWEDANGGGKRSKLSVVAENLQMLGGRPDGEGGDGGGSPAPMRQQRPASSSASERGRQNYQQQRSAPNQSGQAQGRQGASNPPPTGKTSQNPPQSPQGASGGWEPEDNLQFREEDFPF